MNTISTIEINHLSDSSGTHIHDHHQLLFALDGTTDCEMQGRGGIISPAMGCIVPSTEVHHYAGAKQQNDLLVVNIPIHNEIHSLLDNAANDAVVERIFDRPRFIPVDPLLTQVIHQGVTELTFSNTQSLSQLQLTIQLVSMLYQRIGHMTESGFDTSKINIHKINELIDQQLSEPFSVTEMAQHMHISESHFYALFQQQFHMSPYQYFLHRRMEWAQYVLSMQQMSIHDIAQELGFMGTAAFSKAFKRCVGVAPSKVRASDLV